MHVSAPPVSSGSPGRRKAGSLPSLRGPVHATRHVQTRARPSRQDRRPRTEWCFTMGIRYFHHPQKGWPRSLDIRFPRSEQMHQAENVPITAHFRNSLQAHRIRVFFEVGHQHGLLYLRA